MRKFLIVLLLLVSSTALAQNKHRSNRLGTLIDTVAINGALATFTIGPTIGNDTILDYGVLAVYINYDWAAAASIIMTCYALYPDDTKAYKLQSCSVAAGNCTSTDATWTNATSADEAFVWRVDIVGYSRVRCDFTGGASVGANDKVVVKGELVTQ